MKVEEGDLNTKNLLKPRSCTPEVMPSGSMRHQNPPHCTEEVLEAVDKNFRYRVPTDIQAPKMADVWVIVNVWAIIKDKVKAAEPQTKQALRKVITKTWRYINKDKQLLLRLMSSIPKRLRAVIVKKGDQLRPEDY